MVRLPLEIIDQIVLNVECPKYGDDRYTTRSKQLYDEESKWRLSTLRLVNRDFCRSASIRFFRDVRVTLTYRHSRFTACHWPPKRVFDLSRSDWAYNVRELHIDLSKAGGHHDLEYFLDDMISILLACLTNFRRLRAVGLRGPAIDSVDMSENVRLGVRTLAWDLLRYVPMLELKELILALPLTYDYSAMIRRALTSDDTTLRIPLDQAMAGIRHLDLTIYDSTYKDPPSVPPPSSTFNGPTSRHEVQIRPPNHAYAATFFKFVQIPTILESLRISCSHVIDMDHFDIDNLSQLQSLDLKRIKISSTRLIAILQKCSKHLRGVIMEGVELKSGSWRDIFLELCKIDSLVVFHVMDGCTYTPDGTSGHWIPRVRRGHRNPGFHKKIETRELQTTFWADEPALGNLQRHVLGNRVRNDLKCIGLEIYKYVTWEPLRVH